VRQQTTTARPTTRNVRTPMVDDVVDAQWFLHDGRVAVFHADEVAVEKRAMERWGGRGFRPPVGEQAGGGFGFRRIARRRANRDSMRRSK